MSLWFLLKIIILFFIYKINFIKDVDAKHNVLRWCDKKVEYEVKWDNGESPRGEEWVAMHVVET